MSQHTASKRKLVFILGAGHSGSTLLDLLLGSHTKIASLGELSALGAASQRDRENFCGICEADCPIWTPQRRPVFLKHTPAMTQTGGLVGRLVARWHRRARRHYMPTLYNHLFDWFNVPILVDSSKLPGWIGTQIQTLAQSSTIDPLLIYNLRDGRAVVNSFYRKYNDTLAFQQVITNWKETIEQANALYAQATIPKLKVQYERLATDPEDTLNMVCDHLGVEFQPGMLKYWEADHHILFGNAGTRSRIFAYREQTQGGYQAPSAPDQSHGDYYAHHHLGIQLDMRWREELNADQLQTFERLAGDLNRPFEYDTS